MTIQQPKIPPDGQLFLSRKDLHDMGIRVSPATLIRWQNAGRFPKAVRLGGTKIAFPRDKVLAWCEQCIKDGENFQYADF